ncbi:MAG: efflux RND transporter periplasmic adaptor subunit [Bryobacterales bacterium]|nr:efflux RND transporter periplasmic adaptor subunit [Bryobacterales bacterium]
MSKDVKPKVRIGKHGLSGKKKAALWLVGLLLFGGAGYAAYYYGVRTVVEVPTQRVRRGPFVLAVKTRGEVRSTRSIVLQAPQVPNLRIQSLVASGKAVRKGDVIVEFDSASQDQALLERQTTVQTVQSQEVQTRASHKMTDEGDQLTLMNSEFSLERAKLEASKAEILSAIEGEKNRITVSVSEGSLGLVKARVNTHKVSQQADLKRLKTQKEKAQRDLERTQGYLNQMTLRAPVDGVVNILSNFRSGGNFGQADPPFREGDNVWTGAPIAEIPDLSSMRVELKLDEVDRGKVRLGQPVKVRVDAIPDREFDAEITWISPIAALLFRGGPGGASSDKQFPAWALLKSVDPRMRPGMSASVDIVIESQPDVLMIDLRASFTQNGKPSAFVQAGQHFVPRPIEVGLRNESEIVVTNGLREGEMVALVDPTEAVKAKKRL